MKVKSKVSMVKPVKKDLGRLDFSSKDLDFGEIELGEKYKIELVAELTSARQPDRWEISEGMYTPKDKLYSFSITKMVSAKDNTSEKKEKETK